MSADLRDLPVIDVAPLVTGRGDRRSVAAAIDDACRSVGFFYVRNHGISDDLQRDLDRCARAFFALPDEEKGAIAMERGGLAWRGWFPVGGELTSGVPDRKEGIYFGAELPGDDDRVRAGVPLHGANLFPKRPPELAPTVLAYIDAMTALGHALMEGIALALGLDAGWFRANLTFDPLVLFRIFHYPPAPPGDEWWGVGEHTDYGLLTMLLQDENGGLEVRSRSGWIAAPPIPGTFVCNIGDMLDRMTRGRYRSTPHRVRNTAGTSRLSFPFFFDPSWDAEVRPLPIDEPGVDPDAEARERWDGTSVQWFEGTYGEYVVSKVSKVFPELARGATSPPSAGGER